MRRLAVVLIFAMSCGGHEHGDMSHQTPAQTVDSTNAPTSTLSPAAPPQKALPNAGVSGAATPSQRVELNEYSIRMPQTLPQGQQSFTIVNSGKESHSFEIEGGSVHAKLPADLPRGDSATLELNLPPGTYDVYCPVDGHKGKGMSLKVTVQ